FTSFRVVVFPEPLRPSSTTVCPRGTCRFKSERTRWPEDNAYETSLNSIATSLAPVGSIAVKDNGVGEDVRASRPSAADCDESLRPNLSGRETVDEAPHPAFARFDGAHQWMLALVEMLGGVFVLRRVAAPNITALQAEPKMDPSVPFLDALFADMLVGAGELDLIE